ncbi:hypothetical protein H1R20_g7664, partial [Candolleomyces eurysporus]
MDGVPPLIAIARKVGWALGCTGVALTCFRLWDRQRTGRLWWDDCWAFICMLFVIAFMTSFGIYFDDPITWSARISILFTVIRLQYGRIRVIFGLIAVLFGLMWAILEAQLLWTCEGNTEWKYTELPQCHLGFPVALAQLITAIITDAVLISAPIYMVFKSSGLSLAQKIRLTALFSTTMITTVVSLTHGYMILRVAGVQEGLAAIIEATVSLIIANLSVIIAFFFRITTEDTTPTGPAFATNRLGSALDPEAAGGTAPVLTNANFTALFRRHNIPNAPALPVTSTFLTDDGKRIRYENASLGDRSQGSYELGGEGMTKSRENEMYTYSSSQPGMNTTATDPSGYSRSVPYCDTEESYVTRSR